MKFLSFRKSKVSQQVGLPPGVLVHVGKAYSHEVNVALIAYNAQKLVERAEIKTEDWTGNDADSVCWLNIDGVHELPKIQAVGEAFQLHSLILEDIVNTTQRPQVEEYENGLYLVMKMISLDADTGEMDVEQLSMFLGEQGVITFQEKPQDVLEPIRKRLRENLGRLRKRKADYLFYAIMDVVVSHYFTVLEGFEDRIDELEERLHRERSGNLLHDIQQLKKSLIYFRRSISPLREVMAQLGRDQEQQFFEKKTLVFLRDLEGQLKQILELIETFRDVLVNLYDLHFALNGQRMNEIMKVLTIVSTIFIPITFIAGIYGMNFLEMPELKWEHGYAGALSLMGLVVVGSLFFFHRRGWLK